MEKIGKRIARFDASFLDEIATAYPLCSNVRNVTAWYNRFDALTLALEGGTSTYRQVEDHIFELKVLHYLRMSFPTSSLTYEPVGLDVNGRDCDIEARHNDRSYLIEIKTVHPEWRRGRIPVDRISPNNDVIMDEHSYHSYQAVRGHLIDIAYETEEKIANYPSGSTTVLAMPNDFHIDIEELRDFVFLYRHGRPRVDDPLGNMTMHNLRGPFRGTIQEFWSMPFSQQSFAFEGELPTVVEPLKSRDRSVAI